VRFGKRGRFAFVGLSPREQLAEALLRRLSAGLGIDGAGEAQHQVLGAVEVAPMPLQILVGEALQVGPGPVDRLAQGVILKRVLVGDDVQIDLAAPIVEGIQDLFQDDRTFDVDVPKVGRRKHPAQEFGGLADELGVDRGLVARVVPGRVAVQEAAQVFHGRVEGRGVRVTFATPEEHVLQEVRQAIAAGLFMAAAHPSEDRDGRRVEVGHGDGHHRQSVVQVGLVQAIGGQSGLRRSRSGRSNNS
jgi:hypothetical protein